MTLNQLKYFCTACRTRSITKASEELFVTQPTISIAIKDLEAEFNIILFARNGNHLELTSAGETFYEKAKDLLKHSTEMQNEFLKLGNRVPVLKIGIPPMFSTIFFLKYLMHLNRIILISRQSSMNSALCVHVISYRMKSLTLQLLIWSNLI